MSEIKNKTIAIGTTDVDYEHIVNTENSNIYNTNRSFWNTKTNDFLEAISLPLYGAFVSEEKHQLLGKLDDKKVLEICCGNGQSLAYAGENNAKELWGIDISSEQIKKAKKHLKELNLSANLFCSPMEEQCGIPLNYFDVIYSVYGIGWAVDLESTFKLFASYLKPNGVIVFSWSHPIHKCVSIEDDSMKFVKNYFDESWFSMSVGGEQLSMVDRKLSTYINALIKAGFVIEELIEESDCDLLEIESGELVEKAKMIPLTFVIRAKII